MKGLCLILDSDLLRFPASEAMTAAITAGVRFFQYRNKRGSRKEIYETCLHLNAIARAAGALFIVNDHPDIAAAADAGGVHLGQDDLPLKEAKRVIGRRKIIGISTHSKEEAVAAEEAGADYIGFGPVFSTLTKNAGHAQGLQSVSIIKRSVSIPVIAIGGINSGNAAGVMAAGADGVAVISAILSKTDLKQAAADIIRAIEGFKGGI